MSVLPSQITGLQVDVLDDVASWDALEPEWGELFETSPTASPPLAGNGSASGGGFTGLSTEAGGCGS